MHIVTFYSFKGGVGRTLALVNVAAELAKRGRRVLIVDFDLEAPGVQTFAPFFNKKDNEGVVDYVTEYINSGRAPVASNFILENSIDDHKIWLMPAGRQDREYADKLNAIDWLSLYRDFDGYLMFEDLKQQWSASHSFDYVLIDSRTGHTDVAGICTRQLPDAVVLLFIPNDQNLSGLKDIVEDIRSEAEGARRKKIQLHFCPSNVPDLDDEEQILQRRLNEAKSLLGYESPASIITHYNSLALLDQEIFVKERPTTRLAREYLSLVDAIVSANLEDRAGALARLRNIRDSLRGDRDSIDLEDVEWAIDKIYKHHAEDGEVAWSLSLVYEMLGDQDAQIDALTKAIDKRFNEARARSKRAQVLSRAPGNQLVVEDLRSVVLSDEASIPDLVAAVQKLRELDSDWLPVLQKSRGVKLLKGSELNRVATALATDKAGARFAAELLNDQFDYVSRGHRVMALIGAGDFKAVRKELSREKVLKGEQVENVFNLACAEWGDTGLPPKDLFERVIEMTSATYKSYSDPNFLQCMCMSYYVTGSTGQARLVLDKADVAIDAMPPTSIFSGWRFLFVRKAEFRSDVEEMRLQMAEGKMTPKFTLPTLN